MNDPRNILPTRPDQLVVLVVDDEPIVRNVATLVLQSQGYFVLSASDGDEALQLAQHYPGTIHLLLTDIRMPHLDGFQLCDCMSVERPATRVLLMSGQTDVPTSVPFLRKPFDPEMLKTAVRKALGEHRSAGVPA